jgi:tetratricopeptide (TPR) repeat protein
MLKEVASEKPTLDFVHTALGRSLLALEELPDSLKAFEKAESVNPKSEEALFGKATVLQLQGSTQAAKDQLDKAIKQGAKSPETFLKLATIFISEDNSADAAALLEKALSLSPDNHQANFLLAKLLSNQGEFARALSLVSHALSTAESAEYLMLEGLILESMGELDKAVTSFEKASSIDSKLEQAHIEKAFCLAKIGNIALASEEIAKISPDASDYKVLYIKAAIEKDAGHFAQARELMLEAKANAQKSDIEYFEIFSNEIDDIIASKAASSTSAELDSLRGRVSFSADADHESGARRLSSSVRKSIGRDEKDDEANQDFFDALDEVLDEHDTDLIGSAADA